MEENLGENISILNILNEIKHYICLLTRKNSDVIEYYIAQDVKYGNNKMLLFIKKLGICQNNSSLKKINRVLNRNELEKFIWLVASSNSIQGKSNSVKKAIAEFITNKNIKFYKKLRDGNINLVQEMEKYVYVKSNFKRHECSWCSKICKYLNEYLFNNDKYYIYDNNVKNRLNDYRKYYKLYKISMKSINIQTEIDWYINFWNSLDELRKSLSNKLSRSEIDHIMWGFDKFKVQLARISN